MFILNVIIKGSAERTPELTSGPLAQIGLNLIVHILMDLQFTQFDKPFTAIGPIAHEGPLTRVFPSNMGVHRTRIQGADTEPTARPMTGLRSECRSVRYDLMLTILMSGL